MGIAGSGIIAYNGFNIKPPTVKKYFGAWPNKLKRGVLSKDAVYNLITEHRELIVRRSKAVTAALEKNML